MNYKNKSKWILKKNNNKYKRTILNYNKRMI